MLFWLEIFAIALRIYNGLLSEGTEPIIILWALTRELRLANHMASGLRQGMGIDAVIEQVARPHKQVPFMLKKRKGHYMNFIHRHGERAIREMMSHGAKIDKMLKGADPSGNPADELQGLAMHMAGLPTPASLIQI